MTPAEVQWIGACGLGSLLTIPQGIRVNRGLLNVLVERWHSDHNTFHLPTGEMTMTPEDVYRILRILVVGALVVYDHKEIGGIEALRRICGDISLLGYWVSCVDFSRYPALVVVLVAFIGGFHGLDHRSKGFLVGWSRMLEWMVM